MYSHKELDRKIRELQPKLWKVAPLTALIIVGFSVMNIVLGIGMFTHVARVASTLTIVNEIMTYEIWGMIFLALGIFSSWGYLTNNWRAMRLSLIAGVFFKLWWLSAIIIRIPLGPTENTNIILLCLWGLLTYIQIVTYIKFTPEIKGHE